MKIKKHITGFTLIELMVAMAVIGIGLAITVPAMQNFTNVNRKAEQLNKLVRDMTYAKSEAINRGSSYCIRSTTDTATWDGGWRVTNATDTETLRTSTTIAIPNETISSSGGFTSLCFRPDGSTPTAGFTIEQCSACFEIPNREKQLSVSATGRISLNSQYACPATPACP